MRAEELPEGPLGPAYLALISYEDQKESPEMAGPLLPTGHRPGQALSG